MESINNSKNSDLTIIMKAHRLTTLESFDRIIMMNKGKIANDGKFSELIKNDQFFIFWIIMRSYIAPAIGVLLLCGFFFLIDIKEIGNLLLSAELGKVFFGPPLWAFC